MNQVVLIGRLTRDPELRYAPSGTPVASFTLAVDKELSREKKQEMEASGKQTADFIRIVVWGRSGENCANYLTKGSQCAVSGRIQTSNYVAQDGTKRYSTDVVANRVEFLQTRSQQPQGQPYQAQGARRPAGAPDLDPPIDDFTEMTEEDFPF